MELETLYKLQDKNKCYYCEECNKHFTPREVSAYEFLAVHCPECESRIE